MKDKMFDNYRAHLGGSYPLRLTPALELDITMDVLDGCSMSCPGCFVNKKNSGTNKDFEIVSDLTKQFLKKGFEANELFLGPTDFLASKNTESVLNAPAFKDLIESYYALTLTSTMMSDYEYTKKIISRLEELLLETDTDFEIFVIIDILHYTKKDKKYLDRFNKNLSLLKNLKIKPNIQFTVNYYEGAFDEVSFPDLSEQIKEDYGVKLRINPSFARVKRSELFFRLSNDLKSSLKSQLTRENIQKTYLNMIDAHYGGDTFLTLAYKNQNLYLSPFFYDFIFVDVPDLLIASSENGFYSADSVMSKVTVQDTKQYAFAGETQSCNSCEFLPNCVSRKQLSLMEIHNIKKCIVPKDLYRSAFVEMENLKGKVV